MELNDLQREALKNVIKSKLALWDATSRAEELLGLEVETTGQDISDVCCGLADEQDVDVLDDGTLLSIVRD